MGFTRIVAGKDGRAVATDYQIPGDIRQREEEKAASIQKSKTESRTTAFSALIPVQRLESPVPDPPEGDPFVPIFPDDKPTSKEKK